MCGIATLAIVMSSTCSRVAAITPTISSRWLSTGSTATSSTWFAGGVVLPPRAVRAALATSLPLPTVGEHGDVGREPGDQRPRTRRVDRDPNRYALGDLYPVPGRVLRREHRKLRPGAGTDRGDMPPEHDPGVGIETDFCRLTDAHLVELGLLDVGFDVGAGVCDDGRHRRAGDRLLAELKPVGLRDAARDRRAAFGPAQREIGFGPPRHGHGHLRIYPGHRRP